MVAPPVPVPSCLQPKSKFFLSFPRMKILYKIRNVILPFSILFASVLAKHSSSEFEIQIRSGDLTPASRKLLCILEEDFRTLQYKDKIRITFQSSRSSVNEHTLHQHPYILDLLDVVEDVVTRWFIDIIDREHRNSLKLRRMKNMSLCEEKCSMGPTVYNFTSVPLSSRLNKLLKNGLNDVPAVDTTKEELMEELQNEVIIASKNLFFAHYGKYPWISSSSLDKSILSIISQCSADS